MNQRYGERIGDNGVRFQRLLPGPIERVWEYLTDGEKRAKWLAGGEMELKVGGKIQLDFHHATLSSRQDDPPPAKYADMPDRMSYQGEVLACDPPRLLSHTWVDGDGITEVRYELESQGEDVLLTLTHQRINDPEELLGVAGGWHTHLAILIDVLTGREPQPFWRVHTQLEADYRARLSNNSS